jgi:hypothetical protein
VTLLREGLRWCHAASISSRRTWLLPVLVIPRAVASGGTGRALQLVPPADRDKVVNAAHHAFVTGFNTIAMVSVGVAAVGSVAGYALVRPRDFVTAGQPATHTSIAAVPR